MVSFSMEELSEIINDLNIVTKIKCVLYDKDFNILHDYRAQMNSFCAAVRTNDEYCRRCLASDMKGYELSVRKKRAVTYKCHMGLYETLTPIMCDGIIIGFILFGQNLRDEDIDEVEASIESFPEAEKRELLRHSLDAMRPISDGENMAMARIIELCSSYIRMKKLINLNETPLKKQMDDYLCEHMSDKITIETLSKHFKMSRSSLYNFSLETYGMGITEYLGKLRLDRAECLLRDTDMTVSEISEAVGISDNNYFIKFFKKRKGCPPGEWRGRYVRSKNDRKY